MQEYFSGDAKELSCEEAISWLAELAGQGDFDALVAIRSAYAEGKAGKFDAEWLEELTRKCSVAVFNRLKEAAEQGDAIQQYRLGDSYLRGAGTDVDKEKAEYWHKLAFSGLVKAAENGDAQAQLFLGSCYQCGAGVSKDEYVAFTWFMSAAKLGSDEAMKRVGDCYRYGYGVERSFEDTMRWYGQSVEQGNTTAMVAIESVSKIDFEKGASEKDPLEKLERLLKLNKLET